MKVLECFVDADFSGDWNANYPLNPTSVLSRTGFFITYSGLPTFWSSKLQTEIELSTCEVEHISLSTEMREVTPVIQLLKDLKVTCNVIITPPTVTYKKFEDNQSCIEVVESKNPLTRTKNVAIKHHHFLNLVDNGFIKISCIDTKKQLIDVLNKPIESN